MPNDVMQRVLFDKPTDSKGRHTTTFSNNLKLPIHRWFKYSAGFSATWVHEVLRDAKAARVERILDPFAGSGTVPVEALCAGLDVVGIEAHPLVARIAEIKLTPANSKMLEAAGSSICEKASKAKGRIDRYSELIRRCFPDDSLTQLDALQQAINAEPKSPYFGHLWLALLSILRECSPVGTANWQYLLPNKRKAKYATPREAFQKKICMFAQDLSKYRKGLGTAHILQEDARALSGVESGWAQLTITSPPYPNNFDYADATRLEMSFLGEIQSWGDLHEAVRKYLMRSCTQHVSADGETIDRLLANQSLAPIQDELQEVCGNLGAIRASKGGKKPYHLMVAAYFADMAKFFHSLRRVTCAGGNAIMVIGDSAPYGVHVPCDRWMAKLAVAAGFSTALFVPVRQRNIKWKNRKHRVPLVEGRLSIQG